MNEFGSVLENIDLKKYNTYGIGGIAKYMVFPSNEEKLVKLLDYIKDEKISWYILGGGSNLILPDEDYDGVIINLKELNNYEFDKDIINAESGISLGKLVNVMLDAGYTNLSSLMGIPGLLGGAIIGNAGAYGTSIFDYIINVKFIDEDGNIKELNKEEIKYDYRWTEFKEKKVIVLSAKIKCINGNVAEAKEKIKENLEKRRKSQPLEYKNAGSVFRNPPSHAAGYLIEHSGLKGITVGGAMVSEKHANFIINFNNATSRDIIKLVELIKSKVKDVYNVELELEQVKVNW